MANAPPYASALNVSNQAKLKKVLKKKRNPFYEVPRYSLATKTGRDGKANRHLFAKEFFVDLAK